MIAGAVSATNYSAWFIVLSRHYRRCGKETYSLGLAAMPGTTEKEAFLARFRTILPAVLAAMGQADVLVEMP